MSETDDLILGDKELAFLLPSLYRLAEMGYRRGLVARHIRHVAEWLLESRTSGIDSKSRSLTYSKIKLAKQDILDLRFLIVKSLYAYAQREDDKRFTRGLSSRIADELNISKRTVERIAADDSRSFESVIDDLRDAERVDLVAIAFEIYRSIVKPRVAVDQTELSSHDWQSLSILGSIKRTYRERPNFPKSPERRHAHAVRLLRSAIASAFDPSMKPDELTLEMARHVLGAEAPNAETIEELLEALANRDSGRVHEQTDTPSPIDLDFPVNRDDSLKFIVHSTTIDGAITEIYGKLESLEKAIKKTELLESYRALHQIAMRLGNSVQNVGMIGHRVFISSLSITEIDARLEAEAMKLDGNDTELYVRLHTNPKSLTDQERRSIAQKCEDGLRDLDHQMWIDRQSAPFLGIEADDIVRIWNGTDMHERRGSVIADLFNVSRRLRLHFRLDEKPDREPTEEPRTARARRRGARIRARTSEPENRLRSRRRE